MIFMENLDDEGESSKLNSFQINRSFSRISKQLSECGRDVILEEAHGPELNQIREPQLNSVVGKA